MFLSVPLQGVGICESRLNFLSPEMFFFFVPSRLSEKTVMDLREREREREREGGEGGLLLVAFLFSPHH